MGMTKAYDFAYLFESVKKPVIHAGLGGAERIVDAVYSGVKVWFAESAKLTSTPFDDLAAAGMGAVDGVIKEAIGKIDGE